MYKVIHRTSGEEIILLDTDWVDNPAELKRLSDNDLLICPGCERAVSVRLGKQRRWHFAHRSLDDCSYGNDSPALLQARAVLYRWLVSKFKSGVTIEKVLEGSSLPRYFDCWVESNDKPFAYWILEKSIKPDTRDAIKSLIRSNKIHVNLVFTNEMLREDTALPDAVLLSATERDLAQTSEYDKPFHRKYSRGTSIHYLNPEDITVIYFRGLHSSHGVQQFKGTRLSAALADLRVSPKTGEFVHPGEHEQLRNFEEQQKRVASSSIEFSRSIRQTPITEIHEGSQTSVSRSRNHGLYEDNPVVIVSTGNAPAPCQFCGLVTTNWWTYNGATGLCKCRDCLAKDIH